MPMIEQCREIVHKFNAVYGETLTEPQIILPENASCCRLPGIDGKAEDEQIAWKLHLPFG